MKWVFEALSIFNWPGAAIGSAKGVVAFLEDNNLSVIGVNKGELNAAKKQLGEGGIRVVNDVSEPFNSEAFIYVSTKEISGARTVLSKGRIDNW